MFNEVLNTLAAIAAIATFLLDLWQVLSIRFKQKRKDSAKKGSGR